MLALWQQRHYVSIDLDEEQATTYFSLEHRWEEWESFTCSHPPGVREGPDFRSRDSIKFWSIGTALTGTAYMA